MSYNKFALCTNKSIKILTDIANRQARQLIRLRKEMEQLKIELREHKTHEMKNVQMRIMSCGRI